MNRAYSVLTVKAVDDDLRVITGIATTPTPDRMGDVVEPLGVQFKNPMPLLHQHDSSAPVGTVKFLPPTAEGIAFEAQLPIIVEPGLLRDRVDTAWGEVKAGLVRAVSIGFRPLEYSVMEDGGYRFIESEVLELSLVTIPANADATITTIRTIDTRQRAASGHLNGGEVRVPPGASGNPEPNPKPQKGKTMPKTIAEQISAFEATRQAKAARMTDLMNAAAEEGATLDQAQTEEYDTLAAEVRSIDAHLGRLSEMEKTNRASAKPVEGVIDTKTGGEVRGGGRVEVKGSNLPKGTAFTRYAIALARSHGNLMQAAEIAKGWNDSTPEVETVLKAAVAAGTTTGTTWAAPLVQYDTMSNEFVELLRPQTIIGRIPGLRRVPFNISMPRQTAGSTVGWVGEGAPKPVGALAFDTVTLRFAKAAGIVVLTDELVRFSNPSAEAIVRGDLIAAMAQFLDAQFVNPAVAEVTNVSPASITNGAYYLTASGTDADAVKADVANLFGHFIAANQSPANGVWIMTPTMALALSMMQNALGQPEFPTINMNGGTFYGLPVVTSANIARSVVADLDVDTVVGDHIILVDASEVMLADDGQVMLDASREASLQMDSAPTNPPVAATVLVSLWQMNMVGLRAERWINWKRRRDTAVAYISGANYAPG